jgi:hypothetical protein
MDELELHAIVRPGWVQLFRFTAKARKRSADNQIAKEPSTIFGAALCDERRGRNGMTQVELFDSHDAQLESLREYSSGMIVCRKGQNRGAIWILFMVILVVVMMAIFSLYSNP